MVLGAGGMLATDMELLLAEQGREFTAATRDDVDITDPGAVHQAVAQADVVVNCAAYTAVDAAETDEPAALVLNGTAAGLVAQACAQSGARLIHISTDYVFAGDADTPYAEQAPVAPRSAYGRTKAEGERLVLAAQADALVVRTAWLYGAHGQCFPKTIARVAQERGDIAVVDDQHGQPTWTRDLAAFIVGLVDAQAPAGIYHGTSSGQCTWFEFASAVVMAAGIDAQVNPTTTEAFPRPAPRPAWSVLGHDAAAAAGVESIGHWRDRWQLAASEVLA